jgi:hypothetical protein
MIASVCGEMAAERVRRVQAAEQFVAGGGVSYAYSQDTVKKNSLYSTLCIEGGLVRQETPAFVPYATPGTIE